MLYREIIAVCSQIHTEHIKTQSVPRSKHSVSVIQTNQLMLYREIIAVCSQTHTEHRNTAVWAERTIRTAVKLLSSLMLIANSHRFKFVCVPVRNHRDYYTQNTLRSSRFL